MSNCLPLIELERCRGSYGKIDFSAPPGVATFGDNGRALQKWTGCGCGRATPNCDVIAGAISGCLKPQPIGNPLLSGVSP